MFRLIVYQVYFMLNDDSNGFFFKLENWFASFFINIYLIELERSIEVEFSID